MPAPIVHFEFGTKMAAKLKSFYSDLFGWRFEEHPGMNYALALTHEGEGYLPPAGNINGGIFPFEHGPAYLTIYADVPDIAASLEKAVELGAQRIMDIQTIPGVGQVVMFTDPEGHAIGMIQHESPASG